MPVTAKLLRTFYQTFGQHVTEELVDWANELDTSLRSDLREITDQYYARFDAKLEQRMSEVRADIKALDAKLEQRIAESKTELIKYMFAFWAGSAVTTVATVWGAINLIR